MPGGTATPWTAPAPATSPASTSSTPPDELGTRVAAGAKRSGEDHHHRDPGRVPDAFGRRGQRPRGRSGQRERAVAGADGRGVAVVARPRQVAGARPALPPREVLRAVLHTGAAAAL